MKPEYHDESGGGGTITSGVTGVLVITNTQTVRRADFTNKPVNTKHLYNICTMLDQRRRRWVDVVQMLHKCFVFAGNHL